MAQVLVDIHQNNQNYYCLLVANRRQYGGQRVSSVLTINPATQEINWMMAAAFG